MDSQTTEKTTTTMTSSTPPARDPPSGLMSGGEVPVALDVSRVDAEQGRTPGDDTPKMLANDDEVLAVGKWRRWIILFTVCWLPIPMTFATSSVLAVTPEIAKDLGVDETAIHIANAGVFVAMAMSPLIWNPVSRLMGRRKGYLLAVCLLCLCSVGSALAPNLAAFTAIWVIGGTTGVVFLVSGQTILSDIFEPVGHLPTERDGSSTDDTKDNSRYSCRLLSGNLRQRQHNR